jgi:anti-anti-sigma regulatory factor
MLPEVPVEQKRALNSIKAERTSGMHANRKAEQCMEMNQKGFMEKSNSAPEKPDSTRVINLGEDLSIAHAGKLGQIILEALNAGGQIVISCSECANMDLSFLQLLCSAHRTALKSTSTLKLSDTLKEQLLRKAGEAGYFRETACSSDNTHECFWMRR